MSHGSRHNHDMQGEILELRKDVNELSGILIKRLGGTTTKLDATSNLHSLFVPALKLRDLGTNAFAETADISNYPDGESYFALSASTGWPYAAGFVITKKFSVDASSRIIQYCYPKNNSENDQNVGYFRSENSAGTAWSYWRLIKGYANGISTGTDFSVSTGSTWEDLATLTISELHDDFRCSLIMTGDASYQRVTNDDSNCQLRFRYSLDGGTGYQNTVSVRCGVFAGNTYQSNALSRHAVDLDVTGSIIVKTQALTAQTTTVVTANGLTVQIT